MTADSTPLNAEIRANMARKGLNGGDVASMLGLSRGAVSRRLTGQTDWTVNELTAVASFLGVTVAALLGSAEVPA